ncbi:BTB/POZ domain-containing protein POB1 [Acorus calamus]|uniref:BTB/POZ domain-containing protein POB1 n=1 Tax=Acorus calamus TaxID=4465 RepID=A0AAV9C374_ACOCL|nr:BTB/POZ domain-containing protein POB1 [Acorus calamus]
MDGTDDESHGNATKWMQNQKRKREENGEDDVKEIPRVEQIHVNSAILALKSLFFRKLFSNGMKESDPENETTVRIHDSEEASLMELLHYMYGRKLSSTTESYGVLLDLLMLADKFQVVTCVRDCIEFLLKLNMTTESALLYLELPSCVLMCNEILALTDAAKNYLTKLYKNLSLLKDEFLNLTMSGVEAVLKSDEARVSSEDEIIVNDALFFKAEPLYQKDAFATQDTTNRQFIRRASDYLPVRVIEAKHPKRHTVIYFDLTREEYADDRLLAACTRHFLWGDVIFCGTLEKRFPASKYSEFKFNLWDI